jgi:hypothetical protein
MLKFRMTWVQLVIGVLGALCMPLSQAIAEDVGQVAPATALGDWLADRPDPPGTPTKVAVSLHIFDIDAIDDIKQQFSADLFLNVVWRDARLAVPEADRLGRTRTFSVEEIWTPRGLVVNDRGLVAQLPRVAAVDDNGEVKIQQRLAGVLSANLQFREFPFDIQRLPVDFISYQYSPAELEFVSPALFTGDAEAFSADGWGLILLEPHIGEYQVPQIVDAERARITFGVQASRDTDYYLTTMFVPMVLIVFMAWTVFWLQPDIVPARISLSTASIFSLIAFGFSIRLMLPKISYLTRADLFVIGTTLMVFLALAVAVIGSRWAVSDRMEQALKLNAVCRYVYVALFVMVAIVARYL